VIYFSFAALPLFGLGQALIPITDVSRRRTSFFLLAVYVASGLALLMTTCFLGLRRYLRQRRLRMPAAMTSVWLICGVTLIVLLLGAGALIPRPQAEYALFDWQTITGGEKSASKNAVKGDSPGKGEGRGGDSPDKSDASNKASDNKGKGKEQGKDGGDGGEQKGKGEPGGDKGEGQKGSSQDKSKGGDGDKDGKDGRADKNNRQGSPQDGGKPREASQEGRSKSPLLESMSSGIGKILKWIVFVIVGLVTLGVVVFAVIRFLANFTGWAARLLEAWSRFWNRLFSGQKRKKASNVAATAQALARPPRPFSSYHNPFRLGQHWTPFELCCYTFAAFEARTRELGVARLRGETPLEHAERLGAEIPDLENDARRLALIYARGLYGQAELPPAINAVLEEVWERMEAGAGQSVAV
jgi:uncharacterized protein DUF4129